MLFIFISVILLTCLLAGWGALFVRFMHIETDNPWLYPFLGMFAAGTTFSAISMFLPLNGPALIVFILTGLAGLPFWARGLKAWHSSHSREACILFLALTLACTLLMASLGAHKEWMGIAYDADLYHANIVRWLNEYGTPLGLANLHTRLGNNSIWLVLAALFDNVYWNDCIAWVMPALSASGVTAYLLHNVLFGTAGTVRLFCGCMLFFAVGINMRVMNYPNLYYDFPAQFVNIIVFTECLARAEDGWNIKPGQAAVILCLAALAFAIKPVAGVSVLFAVGVALYGLKKAGLFSPANLWVAFLPAVTAGIIWMARNSLLSGYPLFPLPFFSLSMDWTVPKGMIVGTYEGIIAWARLPGPGYLESLHNGNWVMPWLKRHVASRTFWLFVGLPFLAALPLWIKAFCRRRNARSAFFGLWAALCLLYWFFSAPDMRFGMVFFQIFFSLGLLFAFQEVPWLAAWDARCANLPHNRRLGVAVSIIALLIAVSASAITLHSPKRSVLLVGSIPSRELRSRPLDISVSPPILLFFPAEAGSDQCGNSPLPCAPSYDSRLRLRRPGDLGGGFYIE